MQRRLTAGPHEEIDMQAGVDDVVPAECPPGAGCRHIHHSPRIEDREQLTRRVVVAPDLLQHLGD